VLEQLSPATGTGDELEFQSARLGLAAEHPDRTGLPRRPLTDAPARDSFLLVCFA
jgi:hypothetical protein